MNTKWRELDLDGGGLQAANLRLARMLRRRSVAYGLMLVFPLGAHRWYLAEPLGAALYPGLTATAVAGWMGSMALLSLAALLAMGALLARDLYTLENRIAAFNKRQRMAVFLSQGSGAPAGYRGRFATDTEDSGTTQNPGGVPTLAEQEAMLRDLAAHHKKNPK